MKHSILLPVSLSFLILNSCVPGSMAATPTNAPPARRTSIALPAASPVQDDAVNAKLQLVPINGITEFKKNKVLVLELVNHSQDTIWLPPDYGIKVFVRKGGTWVSAKNNFGYASEDVLLAPKGGQYSDAFVALAPLVDDSIAPVTIRVLVAGKLYVNNAPSSTEITAATEFTLRP